MNRYPDFMANVWPGRLWRLGAVLCFLFGHIKVTGNSFLPPFGVKYQMVCGRCRKHLGDLEIRTWTGASRHIYMDWTP